MKNRAKCKLCASIIESFHATDYVECKCGEIAVYDGEALRCSAKDFKNFIRIDDNGQEIVCKVTAKDEVKPVDEYTKPSKEELLYMLDEMAKNIERLPTQAMQEPITHYDHCALITLLSAILRS